MSTSFIVYFHIIVTTQASLISLLVYIVCISLVRRCDDSISVFSSFWNKDVPDCLLQMISLETLQLAGNGLRGDISKFDMPRVNVFSISGNKFRGELPSSIKNKSFEVFDISNNQITGYLDMDISSASPANSSADTDVSVSSDGTTTFRAEFWTVICFPVRVFLHLMRDIATTSVAVSTWKCLCMFGLG